MEKAQNYAAFFIEAGVDPERVREFLQEAVGQALEIHSVTKDLMSEREQLKRELCLTEMRILQSVIRQACSGNSNY